MTTCRRRRRKRTAAAVQVATLDYDDYLGYVAIGRIRRGVVRPGERVALRDGAEDRGVPRIGKVLASQGLKRSAVAEASAGDIVAVTGMEELNVGETVVTRSSRRSCRRSASTSRRSR